MAQKQGVNAGIGSRELKTVRNNGLRRCAGTKSKRLQDRAFLYSPNPYPYSLFPIPYSLFSHLGVMFVMGKSQ